MDDGDVRAARPAGGVRTSQVNDHPAGCHYEETDLDSAARVDAVHPSVDRPTRPR